MTDKTDTGPIEFDWDGLRRTVLVGVYMGGELTEWRNATPADLRAAGFIRKPTPEPGEPVDWKGPALPKGAGRAVPAETAEETVTMSRAEFDASIKRDLDAYNAVCAERDQLQSALTRAEGRVREMEAELDQVCDVLYHTGATRGDALTRAKRAKNTYKELINESADRDEAIEGALRELDSVVSTARERAPSIVYGAINVARSRLRAQPPLASSVVADETTTGLDRVKEERDEAQSALTRAENERGELVNMLHECADIFAARGHHGLAKQYRPVASALRTQPPLANPPEASNNGWTDEQRAALGQVADALERALPSLTDEERLVALNSIYRRRSQPPLASSVVADEATTGEASEADKGWKPWAGTWVKIRELRNARAWQVYEVRHNDNGDMQVRPQGGEVWWFVEQLEPAEAERSHLQEARYQFGEMLRQHGVSGARDPQYHLWEAVLSHLEALESRAAKEGSDGR